jgi:hypothetical protein
MFGLILVGGWGYPSHYFWGSGCLLSIGTAIAPFWRFRRSVWYWPSVTILIIINLAMLYGNEDYIAHRDLPSKGAVAGLFVLDCMACWLLMVGIA